MAVLSPPLPSSLKGPATVNLINVKLVTSWARLCYCGSRVCLPTSLKWHVNLSLIYVKHKIRTKTQLRFLKESVWCVCCLLCCWYSCGSYVSDTFRRRTTAFSLETKRSNASLWFCLLRVHSCIQVLTGVTDWPCRKFINFELHERIHLQMWHCILYFKKYNSFYFLGIGAYAFNFSRQKQETSLEFGANLANIANTRPDKHS